MIERNIYFIIRPLLTNPMIPTLKEILTGKNMATGILHDFKFAMSPLAITIGVIFDEQLGDDIIVDERIAKWFHDSLINAMYSLTDSEPSLSEWCRLMERCNVSCTEKIASLYFTPSDLFRQVLAMCVSNMLEDSSRWPERHGYKIKIDIHEVELGYMCDVAKFHNPEFGYKYQQEWADHPQPDISSSRWSLICKGNMNKIFWEHPWEYFVQKFFKSPILSEEGNHQDQIRQTVLPPRALQ